MAYQLKCKAIALTVEAQAFKKQEHRLKKWKHRAEVGREKVKKLNKKHNPSQLNGIHLHRIRDIRKEARCALLAYGFLNGLRYVEMENFAWTQPNWDRIEKLACRYGAGSDQRIKQKFAQWKDEALGGVPPRWCETVVPGSIKCDTGQWNPNYATYNTDWIQMQLKRNDKNTTI